MKLPIYLSVLLAMLLLSAQQCVQAQTVFTLEKALAYAEQNSPDIQQVLFSLESSQQSLLAQEAGLKSRFSLTVNPFKYSNTRRFDSFNSQWFTQESFNSFGTFNIDQPILFTNGTVSLRNRFEWQDNSSEKMAGTVANTSFSNNLYIELSQPLFQYNSLKQDLQKLKLDYENSKINYALRRLSLEREVTSSFYELYLAELQLEIAKDELKNSKENFEIIKSKVDAGLSAREELYQSEVNYADAQSSEENAELSLANKYDSFKQKIGLDIETEISVIAEVKVNEVKVDISKAIEIALATRMEIRQREIDIENAQFDLITIKERNDFGGTLDLSLGLTGDNEKLTNIYENPTRSPSINLTLNIPIFDWGKRKAQIKAKEAAIKSKQLSFEQEKLGIIISLRKISRTLDNLYRKIDIQDKRLRNSNLTYEINKEKYKNGDLTGLDLSQYQKQLSDAKKAKANALINYKIELLNLKIQSLYDFQTSTPILPQELYIVEQ